MADPRRGLEAFLPDAERLALKAQQLLRTMEVPIHPSQVQEFFHLIHTLKGTASMIPVCGDLVETLHELEAVLACQSLTEAGENPDWVDLAESSLRTARQVIRRWKQDQSRTENLADVISLGAVRSGKPVRGVLLRATIHGRRSELWFPLVSLIRVLTPEELAGRSVLCVDGSWVPVLGKSADVGFSFGVAVQSHTGRAVIAAEQILGIITSEEAAKEGALVGLDLFSVAPASILDLAQEGVEHPPNESASTRRRSSRRAA